MPKNWFRVIVRKQVASQQGFLHFGIITAILLSIIAIFFLLFFKPSPKPLNPFPKPTVNNATPKSTTSAAPQVNKNDLDALENYCKEEALKLPEAPFTYETKEGPTRSGPMGWVNQFIPKDKKEMEKISCTMAYRFDGKTAYPQMGTKYPVGITEFDKAVRMSLSSKIDSSWEKMAGKGISENGLPLVYKKENPQKGTVDFIDAFDGGGVIFIKFNTYYK